MSEEADTKDEMNRMYRWTRHVYDASRKYFLLGRDQLINTLRLKDGEHVCEVGCGTARNLIKMARRYPKTHFYGLDASDEMLKTARGSLKFSGLSERVHVKQSFAQNFDPQELFNLSAPLDKILFSYALSIIPPWQDSIDHAVQLLATGGEIHIVDFGDMKDQPAWFKK